MVWAFLVAALAAARLCAQSPTPGSALQVIGGNYGYVNTTLSLALSNQLTFEAWVQPTGGGCMTILSRGNGGDINTDFIFSIGYDGMGTCGNGSLDLFGARAWDVSAPGVVPTNTWTHVAVTYDGTTKNLYTNGVLAAPRPRRGSLDQSSGPIFIGKQGQVCNCNFFQGQMDEVRIWNLVRTAAEIKQNFRRSLTGSEPGLVAYYRFDEGTNGTAVDATGYGNNATLTSSNMWVESSAPLIAPVTTTLPATFIGPNSATLNGTVNPNNEQTFFWFDYGLTSAYGHSTAPTLLSAANTDLPVRTVVSGLYFGMTEHFRLVATNTAGTNFGVELTLTNPPWVPAISGQSVGSLTATNAVLSARVAPNGADTLAWFQYGLDTNYGSSTIPVLISGTNLNPAQVNSLVGNLIVGTTYHFRTLATNIVRAVTNADQSFTLPIMFQASTALPAVTFGSAAWGDFDNDGRLDVVICGNASGALVTQVWRNTTNGFVKMADLTGLLYSSIALGDFDNDGRLDILISGMDGSNQRWTQLWRNTGVGFTNVTDALFPSQQLAEGKAAWGDFDNDGRLDLLITGSDESGNPVTQLWRNTVNGFTNVADTLAPGIPGLGYCSWGDFDKDGLLDILLSGYSAGFPATEIWRNTGNGFTNVTSDVAPTLVPLGLGAWCDFDNDGWLDLLLSGFDFPGHFTTTLWRNTGTNFVKAADLSSIAAASAAWGDFDNDGRSDLLLSGSTPTANLTQLWRNTTNGFVEVINTVAPSLHSARFDSVAWGDLNNDGRLDLLLCSSSPTPVTQLWQNFATATNSPPTAPSGLSAVFNGSSLILTWNAASDAQTPAGALTYNLRIGTTPGASDVLAPMSASNGWRRLAQPGDLRARQFSFAVPPPFFGQSYFWSVQSIDGGLAGSAFSSEASFTIRPFFSSWGRRADGAFQAQFEVIAGTNYSVQASSDLVHWLDLFDVNFGASGPVLFTDPSATNFARRFYRFGQH